MRKLTFIVAIFALLSSTITIGQKRDKEGALMISSYQIADSLFGQLHRENIPSGFLLNRLLKDTNTFVFKTDQLKDSIVDWNNIYLLYAAFKRMALDSSRVPNAMDVYQKASSFIGKMDFVEEKTVYPIGIFDMKYEWFNGKEAIKKELLKRKNLQFFDVPHNKKVYQHKKARMVAPLMGHRSSENMFLVFRRKDFFSNHHSSDDVKSIVVFHNGRKSKVNFGEMFEFKPQKDRNQIFSVHIEYKNGEFFENHCSIQTSFLYNDDGKKSQIKSLVETHPADPRINFKRCEYMGTVVRGLNKLKFCYIKGCNNPYNGFHPVKPYILVGGWRPPLIGKGFKGLWKSYNSNHNDLLLSLLNNGYDIIMVRFNIEQMAPVQGMPEQANLFKEFLEYVNRRKGKINFNENVIQASSLGASSVRLALLEMENEHLSNQNYPHHHSRLFISYDGNYYGANIPLAYQYQIYSGIYHPDFSLIAQGLPFALLLEMAATLEEKSTKELLMYHAKDPNHPNLFYGLQHLQQFIDVVPTHNSLRQTYLNKLDNLFSNISGYYNTHPNQHNAVRQHVLPMPISTRNIAISLGKHRGRNNADPSVGQFFKYAGDTWTDYKIHIGNWVIEDHYLRAAKYTSTYQYIFRRKHLAFTGWLFPFPHIIADHKVKVRYMQDIDNAPGSYLSGAGNFVDLGNVVFPRLLNPVNKSKPRLFTHKSVFSALAINPDYWPSNGAHSRDMQNDLKLMFIDRNHTTPNQDENDYYGYPNLGQPNNHWDITPFEAVFLGDRIQPHISLKDAEDIYTDAVNDFIRNEVEPWYLFLQNDHLGAQARSDYIYRSFRRAKYSIVTGKSVTPKTDIGDYVVEANAAIIMHAGETIDLQPGTHIKAGAYAHLKIQYTPCLKNKSRGSMPNNSEEADNMYKEKTRPTWESSSANESAVVLYPNPAKNYFTVVSKQEVPITAIHIYNLSGTLVRTKKHLYTARYRFQNTLVKGTYIVRVSTKDGKIYPKKLVVL